MRRWCGAGTVKGAEVSWVSAQVKNRKRRIKRSRRMRADVIDQMYYKSAADIILRAVYLACIFSFQLSARIGEDTKSNGTARRPFYRS